MGDGLGNIVIIISFAKSCYHSEIEIEFLRNEIKWINRNIMRSDEREAKKTTSTISFIAFQMYVCMYG